MTTIAIRGKVIAYDSRCTAGTTIVPDGPKAIIIPKHNIVVASAGTASAIVRVIRQLTALAELLWVIDEDFKSAKDVTILTLDAKGNSYVIDAAGWRLMEGEFYAIGSGTDAALAAMHMGADALRAVEIAAMVDANTGPPFQVLRVTDIP